MIMKFNKSSFVLLFNSVYTLQVNAPSLRDIVSFGCNSYIREMLGVMLTFEPQRGIYE